MNIILTNSPYGSLHIICVSCSVIAIVLATIFLRKINISQAIRIALIAGIISEVLKVGTYIIINEDTLGGYLPKTDLPFHLCSIQIIFLIILSITKKESVKRLLLSFMLPTCLIGGFAALMIPTSSSLNVLVITFQYFMFHSVIMWFALQVLLSKEFVLTVSDYWKSLLFLLAIAMAAIYINSALNDYIHNINFMYVVNPPANNLPILNKDHGWLVYILSYGAVAVVAITLFYIKPFILFFKSKKNKDSDNDIIKA